MVLKFFSKSYKGQLIHNRYICCSCYKTQICYTINKPQKVYACHCVHCLTDNNIYTVRENYMKPVIWVNIKRYEIHNEFNNEFIKLKWKKYTPFAKRGYCTYCNDLLIIDYKLSKYIHDNNITPTADLFCKRKDHCLTNKNLTNWFSILSYHYIYN